jgi:hypothetical protein
MKTPKDGGPAFPYAFHFPDQVGEPGGINLGMSLRDHFVSQIAPAVLADHRYAGVGNEAAVAYEVARFSGMVADAMLAERAKNSAQ